MDFTTDPFYVLVILCFMVFLAETTAKTKFRKQFALLSYLHILFIHPNLKSQT